MVGAKPFFLMVHADWCGHCQMLKPEWKKAMESLKTSTPVVEVEESVLRALQQHPQCRAISKVVSESVKGFPTLARVKTFQSKRKTGKSKKQSGGYILNVQHFTGNRVAKDLLSFINQAA